MPNLQGETRPSTIGYGVYGTRMDDTEGTRGGMSLNVDRQAVKRSATASTAQHEAGEQGNRRRWLNALFYVVVFAGRGFSTVPTRGNRGSRTARRCDCGMAGSMGREAGTVIVCTSLVQDRIDYMIDLLLKWFGSCLIHESSSHASHS